MIQYLNSSFYFSLLLKYRFNWGSSVKNLSEKVLKLLESETLHREERARASKLTHRIERFGSFGHQSSSGDATLEDSPFRTYGRCNSNYNDHQHHEIGFPNSSKSFSIEEGTRRAKDTLNYINSALKIGDGYTIADHPLCCNEDPSIVPLLSVDECQPVEEPSLYPAADLLEVLFLFLARTCTL